jgi:hypothetical protein
MIPVVEDDFRDLAQLIFDIFMTRSDRIRQHLTLGRCW